MHEDIALLRSSEKGLASVVGNDRVDADRRSWVARAAPHDNP